VSVDIEIVCVGNELLIGKVENTNAYWLVKHATALGVNVKRITVIEDTVKVIGDTICEVLSHKPQFIITTGGLGPTFDDKTLQGIAAGLGRKLEVNEVALQMVKEKTMEYLKTRGLPPEVELTPPRVKMATLPKGSVPVTNPVGSAPGVRVDLPKTVLFALPGVPLEMEAIFTLSIAPLLQAAVGDTVFCQKSLYLNGMFESKLAPLIDVVMVANQGVYIKSHPILAENKSHTEIHLTMRAKAIEKPAQKIQKAAEQLAILIKQNGGVVSE
jgi:nicotinamide-nucleotide amidase